MKRFLTVREIAILSWRTWLACACLGAFVGQFIGAVAFRDGVDWTIWCPLAVCAALLLWRETRTARARYERMVRRIEEREGA